MRVGMKTMAEAAIANIKSSPTLTGTTVAVMAIAFAGMVTSAYTADHIKRSNSDLSNDENLQKAYTWAWSTALITGVLAAGMAGVVAWTVMKK